MATKEIEQLLKARGMKMFCGVTPVLARLWWEKHVSPALAALLPADEVARTIEELIQKYEGDELPNFKREMTRVEYKGRIGRIRLAFAMVRYARSETEALQPNRLTAVRITRHLHENRHRGPSANKDIRLLSRMFRLGKIRWGLTTYNPCDSIEYLTECRVTSTLATRNTVIYMKQQAQYYGAFSRYLHRQARASV